MQLLNHRKNGENQYKALKPALFFFVCVFMKQSREIFSNLVVESYIHHQHLPSNADPAGATRVVGVYSTSEPHLDTQIMFKSQRTADLQP